MKEQSIIRTLGVYGYDEVEPLIMAALVTGDPLLLIGESGTGKTICLTTHSMEEADALSSRIVIMVNGQMQAMGTIDNS